MRKRLSIRDFVAGAVFGVLLGSVSLSTASMGYTAWEKLSDDFKIGYVTGFLSLANLTRNFDPGGWLDQRYPAVPNATPVQWAAAVDKLYQEPRMQKFSIHSVLQSAATELQKVHGKPLDPYQRVQQRAQTQLQALQKRQEAKAKKEGEKPAPVVKNIQAPEKKVAAPPKKNTGRKWCRCDGKDPKAERARRRAEAAKSAEAEQKDEGSGKDEAGKQGEAQKKDEAAKPAAPAAR
jgi:hypothetical protein